MGDRMARRGDDRPYFGQKRLLPGAAAEIRRNGLGEIFRLPAHGVAQLGKIPPSFAERRRPGVQKGAALHFENLGGVARAEFLHVHGSSSRTGPWLWALALRRPAALYGTQD